MAIQQHPLPQDISNYRFRLIGDMTIKQFASLGISIVVAIIVYSLPLPFFFKYPLSFLFVILGVGMAFVPLQGRTLDVWIIAFIKSIYSPTVFTWKKTPNEDLTADTIAPSESTIYTATSTVSNPGIEILQDKPAAPISIPTNSSTPTPIPTPPTDQIQDVPLVTPPTKTVSTPPTTPEPPKDTLPKIPPEPVAPKIETVIPTPSEAPITTPNPVPQPATNLPIPFTPTTPNTLVGLTISQDNHIIDGVLVEIKKNGITIRATKSNKLGQFMFARPLENGVFQILAEKENFTFSIYSLELTGAIVRPLKIQAV